MKISKRCFVRIISFSVAFLTVAVGFLVCGLSLKCKRDLERKNAYFSELDELDGSVYNISCALLKMSYSNSSLQMSTLSTEICAETQVAKKALSKLPVSNGADTLNSFLSKSGDFPLYLAKKMIKGEALSEDEKESLALLSKTAKSISDALSEIRNEYGNGNGFEALMKSLDIGDVEATVKGFDGLEELLADYPTLLYDGPFSDHMLEIEPKFTKGKSEISRSEALSYASRVLGVKKEELKENEETVGNLPCYNFSAASSSISITKQGGYVVYITKQREIGEITLDYDTAVDVALNTVNESSDLKFTSTYYFADEGICTVNLAHLSDNAVCYSDLIKVGVALDNGEIVSVECAGFLTNHYERQCFCPEYSPEEAEEVLSKELEKVSCKEVIIPLDGNREEYCYEFLCEGKNKEELLVYINAETLCEEEIMILLKTDGGTLTK